MASETIDQRPVRRKRRRNHQAIHIAGKLARALADSGLTQGQLAVIAGVGEGRVSEMINGKAANFDDPRRRRTLIKLATALRKPPNYFFPAAAAVPLEVTQLATLIYQRRVTLGLSQEDLATLTGIGQDAISSFENETPGNRRHHQRRTLNALSSALGVDLSAYVDID